MALLERPHESPVRLAGRSAVVVGGTSGFGATTARALADAGARVVVSGRDQGALDRTAADLGPDGSAVRADSASLADLDRLADHVRSRFEHVDLVFVNSGVTRFVPLVDMTEDVYDELFAINAKGAYFAVQKLAPLVSQGGSFVLTTSVANVKGLAGSSAYAATKAAVRSMTRSFARELQPRGIRVNAVSPGPIDTGILERSLPAAAASSAREQMIANNPMGRFGDSAEIAAAVLFLAFEATYSTGTELAVDGGTSQL